MYNIMQIVDDNATQFVFLINNIGATKGKCLLCECLFYSNSEQGRVVNLMWRTWSSALYNLLIVRLPAKPIRYLVNMHAGGSANY